MKIRILKPVLTIVMHLTVLSAFSQDAILSTGGNASGSNGSISFSVGQIVCRTLTSSNGSVSPGVQQPFEISEVQGFFNINSVTLSAYPNPTSDILTLTTEIPEYSSLKFLLYDISGKILITQNVSYKVQTILMGDLCSGVYFLRVTRENQDLKTFQIIKN